MTKATRPQGAKTRTTKKTASQKTAAQKTAAQKTSAKQSRDLIAFTQRGNMPILSIPTPSEDSQVLVTLRRELPGGGSQWLSPIGWGDVKKSTLLDCYPTDSGCEIIIPDTYAKAVDAGDRIHMSCKALNVRGDIAWTAPTPQKVETSATEAAPTGLMSRLLSRATPATEAAVIAAPTDAQRRAEDAQRVSDEYRVQMEAAATAREKAQRQALEAARRAEDALQAEAARIAEMEAAAKAFAEAEAQRQDEERRLEAERRAEELRLAEEARLAQEARDREIALARAQERADEKARLVALQEAASNDRAVLSERIETERSAAHRLSVDQDAKVKARQEIEATLPDQQTHLAILAGDLNAQKNGMSALDDRLQIATAREVETTSLQSDAVLAAEAAEAAYTEAKAALEAARLHAKEMKEIAAHRQSDKDDAVARAEKAARHLASLQDERLAAAAAVKAAQDVYDAAEAESEHRHAEIAALSDDAAELAVGQSQHAAQIKVLAENLEAALSRQDAAQMALQTLEDGGDVRAARQIMAAVETDNGRPAALASNAKNADATSADAKTAQMNTPASTSAFKKLFGKANPAPIAIKDTAKAVAAVDDTKIPTTPKPARDTSKRAALSQKPAVLSAPHINNSASDAPMTNAAMKDASKDIMAAHIAANQTSGGNRAKIAAMGVGAVALTAALGFAWSASTRPDAQQMVSAKPAPAAVLSTDTAVKAEPEAAQSEAALADPALEATPQNMSATPKPTSAPRAQTAELTLPKIKAPTVVAAQPVAPKYKSVDVTKLARDAAKQAARDAAKAKTAQPVKAAPTKPAPKKPAPAKKAPVKTASAPATITPKTVAKEARQPATRQPASLAATPAASTPAAQTPSAPVVKTAALTATSATTPAITTPAIEASPRLSPAVAMTVQQDLKTIGYYNGPVDGVVSESVEDAATLFRTVYDLPASDAIDGAFVSRLNTIATEVKSQPVRVVSAPAVPSPTPRAVISAPAQSATAPQPVIKQAAVTAPPVAKTPVVTVPDVVEPKALQAMQVAYPARAAKRDIYRNVVVDVDYDILADGTVSNARVVDIDYKGRQASAFEDAAIQGVLSQRFSPKMINGTAVAAPAQRKTVRFRVE